MYDTIVQEVEQDLPKVNKPTTYLEQVESEGEITISVPIPFKTAPISAFADYKVRDALIVRCMKDEDFTFVLLNKITNTLHIQSMDDATRLTQDDVEALTFVVHIGAMWEQFEQAERFLGLVDYAIKANNLDKPNLLALTERILTVRSNWDFSNERVSMSDALSLTLQADLDIE
jgi:hypothetical protein